MAVLQPLSSLVLQMKNGTTAEQNQVGRGFPTSRIETISNGSIDPNRVRFVELDAASVDRWKLQHGDILLSHINSVEHIGKSAIYQGVPETLIHGMNLLLLRPDRSLVMSEYLHFGLRSHEVREHIRARCKRAINQASINLKELGAIELPVPSLEEQRRIVDLLSRAEGIVRLRREAEKKAAELIPALFLNLFGDPATNPKGWPVRQVSDFVSRFEGGKNIQAGSENGSAYRILKVSAVTSGVYRESESKPSPNGYSPPTSHLVRAGDMLFSRANTEELVGATAIVEKTDGKTLLPDKLWRFVWNEPVAPAYMHALFQSGHVRRELGKLSSGTSASMRNISQTKLYALPLPIAPYLNQKDFAERSAMIHSIQSQQSAATAKAQATFDALLARCFAQGTAV